MDSKWKKHKIEWKIFPNNGETWKLINNLFILKQEHRQKEYKKNYIPHSLNLQPAVARKHRE